MEVRDGDSTSTSRAFLSFIFTAAALAAQLSPSLLNAKQTAEAKGYTFFASRDEIVAKAKKEGQLRVLYGVTLLPIKVLLKHLRRNIRSSQSNARQK